MKLIVPPPSGKETAQKFAIRFCHDFISREFSPERVWRCQTQSPEWKSVRECCADGKGVVIVNPLAVICRSSLNAIEKAACSMQFDFLGPLMLGGRPEQNPALPFTFQNMEGFRDASEWLAEQNGCEIRVAGDLSPDLLFCSSKIVNLLPDHLPVSEIQRHDCWKHASKGIVANALGHTFTGYYHHVRTDLAELIPEKAVSVLDVGCGAGGLGEYISETRPHIQLSGIEKDHTSASAASECYHRMYAGDAENVIIPEHFDCIVCGDVIEHLHDPWETLIKLNRLLKPEGTLVGSCPNAGHWTVVKGLLEGGFEYIPAGILCWDHVRHFTEYSLRSLLKQCRFTITMLKKDKPAPSTRGEAFLKEMDNQPDVDIESLKTAEFVFMADKSSEPGTRKTSDIE